MKKILVCLALGIITFFAISAMEYLPYYPPLVALQDKLNLPGDLVYGVFFPEGVESEGGGNWVIISVLVNIFVYSVFWFAVVSCFKLLSSRRQTTPAKKGL